MSITGRIVVTGALVSMAVLLTGTLARAGQIRDREIAPAPALLRGREPRVRDGLVEIRALCLGVVVLDDHLALLAVRRGGLDALHRLQLGLCLRRALLALPPVYLDGFRLHGGERGGAQAESNRERERYLLHGCLLEGLPARSYVAARPWCQPGLPDLDSGHGASTLPDGLKKAGSPCRSIPTRFVAGIEASNPRRRRCGSW